MSEVYGAAGTDLVRKGSIEEFCGHRARALGLYRQVAELLAEAKSAHRAACPGEIYLSFPEVSKLDRRLDVAEFVKEARLNIERNMWNGFLKVTPLGALMDSEARKQFRDSLQDPPDVTPETVYATLQQLRTESGKIFRRGLVNCFTKLNRDYKSHDGFKIGDRLVLTNMIRYVTLGKNSYSFSFQRYAEEELRDLDRVFHVLDGKPAPEYQEGLRFAVLEALDKKIWEITTPYFRVKWFKNGNAHLWFTNPDLVDLANLMIAEHFGAAVGAAPHVAEKGHFTNPPPEPALEDFFPTPPALVVLMLEAAQVEPQHRVLEPSAGDAAIAGPLFEIVGNGLWMSEADPSRAADLFIRFPGATGRQHDFLSLRARPEFDRVMMNPPFSGGVDVKHVWHALQFLKPGGRLVAIMSAGVMFRTDRETVRLREEIERLGGSIT